MVVYLKPGTRKRVILALSVVLILLGARMGLSFQGNSRAQGEQAAARITPLSRVNTAQPVVGLIVDVSQAGPDQVRAALAEMKSLEMKGTWFLDVTTVESQSALVKEIIDQGHELGVKGTDDKPVDRLAAVEVKDRVTRAKQAFKNAGVVAAPFIYPPLGRFSDTVVTVSFQEGLQPVKPGFDATSMRGKEDAAAAKMAGAMKPGDILLVKVGRTGLLPQLRYVTALVANLKGHGLGAATLSTLVKGVK